MYTTRQGRAHQGVVELAYEVIHPLEEERDTPGINFVGGWGENGRPGDSRWPGLLHAFPR